jgi:hypothetical protein
LAPLNLFTVLGEAIEPWGCLANVVRGPLGLITLDSSIFTIPDCVFYACKADNPDPAKKKRTANFGVGRLTPWSASGWNVPPFLNVVMQAPLSYATTHPIAEFRYVPVAQNSQNPNPAVRASNSLLVLHPERPSGFTMLNTRQELEWMSVTPKALQIDGVPTLWPGNVLNPIAMVDTGGGPVLLSDPNEYVLTNATLQPAKCPDWLTSDSQNCRCIKNALTLTLTDGLTDYSYTIDPGKLPPSANSLTGVFCDVNEFLWQQQGMNIGGISALFNDILIDYSTAQVGFKPKP